MQMTGDYTLDDQYSSAVEDPIHYTVLELKTQSTIIPE